MSNYNNWVSGDYETGGLKGARISPAMEIALTVLDGITLKPLGNYQTLIRPYLKDGIYDPGAIKVHGITLEEVMDKGIEIALMMKQQQEFVLDLCPFSNKKNRPVWVGHNPFYDTDYQVDIAARTKTDLSKFWQGGVIAGIFIPFCIDTGVLAKMKHNPNPDVKKHTMSYLVELEGLGGFNAHRAGADTEKCGELFKTYAEAIRLEGSGTGAKNHRENVLLNI